VNAKVLLALGADVQILFQVFLPDNLPAALTLHPQPFSADFLLARSVQFAGFAPKPSHSSYESRVPSTEQTRPAADIWPFPVLYVCCSLSIPLSFSRYS